MHLTPIIKHCSNIYVKNIVIVTQFRKEFKSISGMTLDKFLLAINADSCIFSRCLTNSVNVYPKLIVLPYQDHFS